MILAEPHADQIDFRLSSSRGVAQPGSALRSGRRGRRFESSRPDQTELARPGAHSSIEATG